MLPSDRTPAWLSGRPPSEGDGEALIGWVLLFLVVLAVIVLVMVGMDSPPPPD